MFIPPWSGQKCQPSAHNHKEKSWRIHPILHIECFCLLLPTNSIEHCKIPRDFIVFIGFPRRPSVYCTSSTKSGKVLTLFPALRLFHETKHALVQGVFVVVDPGFRDCAEGSGNRLWCFMWTWWNVIRPGMTPSYMVAWDCWVLKNCQWTCYENYRLHNLLSLPNELKA